MSSRTTSTHMLSWIWVTLVAVYSAWSALAYSGLYRLLAEMQIARSGSYYPELTAVLPGFLLASPALAYIGRRSRAARAADAPGPDAEARRTKRVARGMAAAGILALLVGAGAWQLSRSVPDGSEPAIKFDTARLGSAPLPAGKVAIVGEIDPEASTGITETSRTMERNTAYVGFRPRGSPPDAPLVLFVERYVGDADDAAITQAFLPEQTGYLVENGVPELALADLRKRGIAAASPHYLLRTSSDARREPYYIAAALGIFLGFILLLVAGVGAVQARRADGRKSA